MINSSLLELGSRWRLVDDPSPWRTMLFEQQLRSLNDPARRKADLCTRRAGKSTKNASAALDALFEFPALPVLYICLTGKAAKDNLWNMLVDMNSRFGLGLTPDVVGRRFVHRAGGYIALVGCKDIREAEKLRGLKYSRVIIDEGASYRDSVLKYLIEDIVGPALTDVGGDIYLSGTPGLVPVGFFWEVTTGGNPSRRQWSTHQWSVTQNPHHRFGREPAALEEERLELGLSEDDPTWVREYLGRWCLDTRALVYYFSPQKNTWDGVRPDGLRRVTMGIDLGYTDETAFVICEAAHGDPRVVVRHAEGKSGMLTGDVAQAINRLADRYGVTEMYIDWGGLGTTIMNDLQRDYGIPVQRAEKSDKAGAIRRVNQSLSSGNLVLDVGHCGSLIEEWNVLPWNKKRNGHHDDFPDHCSDGLLYAYRPLSHWLAPPKREPDPVEKENEETERLRRIASRARSARRW